MKEPCPNQRNSSTQGRVSMSRLKLQIQKQCQSPETDKRGWSGQKHPALFGPIPNTSGQGLSGSQKGESGCFFSMPGAEDRRVACARLPGHWRDVREWSIEKRQSHRVRRLSPAQSLCVLSSQANYQHSIVTTIPWKGLLFCYVVFVVCDCVMRRLRNVTSSRLETSGSQEPRVRTVTGEKSSMRLNVSWLREAENVSLCKTRPSVIKCGIKRFCFATTSRSLWMIHVLACQLLIIPWSAWSLFSPLYLDLSLSLSQMWVQDVENVLSSMARQLVSRSKSLCDFVIATTLADICVVWSWILGRVSKDNLVFGDSLYRNIYTLIYPVSADKGFEPCAKGDTSTAWKLHTQ